MSFYPLPLSREREGPAGEAGGRVRVFFFGAWQSVQEEDPHPTLSREGGRGL